MARAARAKTHPSNVAIVPKTRGGDVSGDTAFAVYPVDSDFISASPTASLTITNTGIVGTNGAAKMVIGETTTGVTTADGTTMVYGYGYHKTNALTGDLIGVRGNARVNVDSASGCAIGGYFQAANGVDSGYSVGTIRGIYTEIITKTGTDKTVTNARGLEIVMDMDQATTAVTTAFGIRLNMQSGASQGTVSNSAGIVVMNESVSGAGTAYGSAIAVGQISQATGFAYGLDLGPSITDGGSTVSACTFSSADIRLCKGETIDNLTDGTVQVTSGVLKHRYDAAAYWTATQADAGAVTFDSVSDGTAGFTFRDPVTVQHATGVTAAGGTTMLYGYGYHMTNALTGDLIGVRGNTRVTVDSASGCAIGGYFQAANGTDASGGLSVGTLRGIYAEIIKKTGTDKTVTNARGVEIIMDLDQATTAVTTAFGIRLNMQSGATQGTVSNSAGIVVMNESVSGAGTAYGSAIAIGQISQATGFAYGLDLGPSITDGGSTVSACTFSSADIRLCKGETIDNLTDGTVQVTAGVVKHAYDAAAYWTATQADAGAVTFDSVSDGTAGFTFSDPVTVQHPTAVTTAGGTTMLYGYGYHDTNALTGDLIGVRGNVRVAVDSTSGCAIGGYFQAANGTDASGGLSAGTLRGIYAEIIKKTGTDKTVTNARGVEIVMDLDQATTAVTTAFGIRLNMQSGATQGTVSNSAGIVVINESVSGAGTAYGSAIAVGQISQATGFAYGLDLGPSITDGGSTVSACAFGTADIRMSSGAVITSGSGSPDGSVSAAKSSLYLQVDGNTDAQLWVNEDGDTAWGYVDTT